MNHSDTKGLCYWWCAYKRIPHKNSVHPFGQTKIYIFKFLKILIYTEGTRDRKCMVFHRCSVFFYRQQGVYKIVSSVLFTFLATLVAYAINKDHETCWYSHSIACKQKRTDWILRILTFNEKNPLYHPLILTLQFFEGQSD